MLRHLFFLCMKRIFWIVCIGLFLGCSLLSCEKDDNNKDDIYTMISKLPYSTTETYMAMFIDNQKTWQANEFTTCYVKIPTTDNVSWFDIVFLSDSLSNNSSKDTNDRYLFVHVDNPLVKSFSFDSVVCIENNFKIIYYENKKIEENHAIYSKYLTNPTGKLTITYNDGSYMSGNFVGTLYNIYKKQTHNVAFCFNRVPISIAK